MSQWDFAIAIACLGRSCYADQKSLFRSEEPHSHVPVEHPFGPALRISKLRFEAPAIGAPVDQLGGIVLSGAVTLRLAPSKIFWCHFINFCTGIAGPTLRFTEKRVNRVQKTGRVKVLLGTQRSSLKAP